MKVAIDGRTIKNNPSGVGIWNLRLTAQLLTHYDITVYLILPKNCTYNFTKDTTLSNNIGKKLFLIPTAFSYSFVTWKRFLFEQIFLLKILLDIKPDIYHASDSFGLPLFLPKWIKTVVTIHDLIPLTPYREFMSQIQFLIYKLALQITFKKADKIVAISDQTYDDIQKYMHPLFPVMVIPNGLDVPKRLSTYKRNQLWQTFSKSHHLKKYSYLFYFGGFGPRKNVMEVVQTFISLKKHKIIPQHYKLILSGRIKGAKKEALQILEMIQSEVLKDHLPSEILSIDYLSDEIKEMLISYSFCGFFLYQYEGFGFGPTEFLERNKEAIFTKTGVWYSYPTNNLFLLPLVEPKEKRFLRITNILAAKGNEKKQALEECRRFLREFSWEKMAKDYYTVYRQLEK